MINFKIGKKIFIKLYLEYKILKLENSKLSQQQVKFFLIV